MDHYTVRGETGKPDWNDTPRPKMTEREWGQVVQDTRTSMNLVDEAESVLARAKELLADTLTSLSRFQAQFLESAAARMRGTSGPCCSGRPR